MKISFGDNNNFIEYIRETSSSFFQLGTERYTSWVFGSLFRISYYNGKELRKNYPIHNKLMGIVINNKNGGYIRYIFFPGLTDPLSIIINTILALIIFVVAGLSEGISFPILGAMSLAWAFGISIITFLPSKFTTAGKEGRKQLELYLEHFEEYKENLKKYEEKEK